MTFNANDAHVADEGTILQKTVVDGVTPFDLSTTTALNLVVTDAGGNTSSIAGAFETDGTDGIVNFETIATTWQVPGVASEQVQLINPDGAWSSEITKRRIHPKL